MIELDLNGYSVNDISYLRKDLLWDYSIKIGIVKLYIVKRLEIEHYPLICVVDTIYTHNSIIHEYKIVRLSNFHHLMRYVDVFALKKFDDN